ncbi:MAG: MBL fold metallo-hydrolase [Gammaproteobacteria bacterium]|nr:MBL fold metallo-hydrolase [Gammaproteobacteria bacterium]
MIFRQLFDSTSCTYTYLLASRKGGEALLIDPVVEKVDHYVRLLRELDLRLVKALDTHVHADHVTALRALRDKTRCMTVMGEMSSADVVGMRVRDEESIHIEGIRLEVIYTPGHTDDSYSFLCDERVFTGDTLLIRGTGRTDFQNGDARAQYDSIFNRLFKLPDWTQVYPAHDYKGDTVSTIGEERAHNPRLQVSSIDEYVELMAGLNLAYPAMIDVAVPANRALAFDLEPLIEKGLTIEGAELSRRMRESSARLVDLRDPSERGTRGELDLAINLPYGQLATDALMRIERTLHGVLPVFCCQYGEYSAMAAERARACGLKDAVFLLGGIEEWDDAPIIDT